MPPRTYLVSILTMTDALWCLPYCIPAAARMVTRYQWVGIPRRSRRFHHRSSIHDFLREPKIQPETQGRRWMVTGRTASSSGHHWRYLASNRSLFVRLDRCACSYTLDRAHHLFSPVRLWHGPRFPELLQLSDRLVPPSCRFRPRCQLRTPIVVRCWLPSLCIAHVPKPRRQLGLYAHCLFSPSMCAFTTVSRVSRPHCKVANDIAYSTSRADRFDDFPSTVEKPMTWDR
jgi:hypothetical protein